MLKIVNAEVHHIREVQRIGQQYFDESRFKADQVVIQNTWHETVKACIITPNVMLQVLVDDENKCHGFLQAAIQPNGWNDKLTCAVNLIFVDKCCRGKGYAEKFLENVKEWATANHCYEIISGDYAFNPDSTRKWYEKQGYEMVGQQYGFKL